MRKTPNVSFRARDTVDRCKVKKDEASCSVVLPVLAACTRK